MPMISPPASGTSLGDWLTWLESLSPREIELGLERISTVLARLELPRPQRVIHVAGTNGKGSSAAMLEALYWAGGKRVGCYTSPHVLRFNERIRVDRTAIADDAVLAALRQVEAIRGDIPLTFFEYCTAAALAAFATAAAEVLILEIGLGGRLDAVNAVDPDGGLITNIGLDHCDWLGPDLASIAREKAGIMRRDKPVVFAAQAMPSAIADSAEACGAVLIQAGRDFRHQAGNHAWEWRSMGRILDGLAPLSLRGDFQLDNAAGAMALFATLEGPETLTVDRVNAAFAGLQLAGRLHSVGDHWLLDVAHNPAAAAVLAMELERKEWRRGITAVIGVLSDKDVDGILQPLLPLVDRWIAVAPGSRRAMPAAALAARVAAHSGKPCYVADNIGQALCVAERIAAPGQCRLVTGSFFVVGPALEWLNDRPE